MARKRTSNSPKSNFEVPARTIKDIDISDEIETMFVPFAHYTIADRAIPSVLDGLKPSQRRILWCMYESGFHADKPFVKSARITGAVIAQYHPHGDASVYATMANMVKPYILQTPLAWGRGGWGFVAGDVESAARYTECKLQPISDILMEDIRYDAVDMQPNFDERLKEPVALPVTFPLLVVNGASGIAVGFATNCAPHNPGEVIDATIERIRNPKMTVDDLLAIMPGPDFPTGCDIVGNDGIREAYTTGKGIIKQRSRYRIEAVSRGRHTIEFYEIPYGVSPEKAIADINKCRDAHPEYGITEVMDLMDKEHPVRVTVYVKSGINAEVVAEALLDSSPSLYNTFAINQTALLNNVPRVFSMLDMLDCFIDFRRDVITRRTKSQIGKLERDKKFQEALAAVLLDIDAVIAIVRDSNTNDEVYSRLMKKFKLELEQAKYVGDMKLIQLKKKDKLAVEQKIKALEKELKRLHAILKTKTSLNKQLIAELEKAKELVDKPRKSKIIKKTIEQFDKEPRKNKTTAKGSKKASDVEKTSSGDFLVSGTTTVYLSPDGKISHKPKGKGPKSVQRQSDVDLNSIILLVFENGNSLRTQVHELPEKPAIVLSKCTGFMVLDEKGSLDGKLMAMNTSDGNVKVLKCETLTKSDECPVMSLGKNAKILAARPVSDGNQFFTFVTTTANMLYFPVSTVNPQGRTSGGMAGIKLVKDSKVVYAGISNADDILVSYTDKNIKQTPLSEYPVKGRATQGVRCQKFLSGETILVGAYIGKAPIADGVELPPAASRDASGKPAEGLSKAVFYEN